MNLRGMKIFGKKIRGMKKFHNLQINIFKKRYPSPFFGQFFNFPTFSWKIMHFTRFHLQPNLLTFGLNAEYEPPINRRFKYKWNKFTYFLPKMFELWPFPEKRAIAFFRFFPFLRPFHSFFGSEMYETLNRTGWF